MWRIHLNRSMDVCFNVLHVSWPQEPDRQFFQSYLWCRPGFSLKVNWKKHPRIEHQCWRYHQAKLHQYQPDSSSALNKFIPTNKKKLGIWQVGLRSQQLHFHQRGKPVRCACMHHSYTWKYSNLTSSLLIRSWNFFLHLFLDILIEEVLISSWFLSSTWRRLTNRDNFNLYIIKQEDRPNSICKLQ